MTKKVVLGVSVLMALMLFLTSCTFTMSRGEYEALQSRLNVSQLEIDALKANMTALQDSYNDLQADYGNLLASYESLRGDYEDSLERLQQSTLENPTWSELEEFLRLDDTDTIPYIEDSFDCSGFAITLRDRAWRHGMRSAYVEIGFSEGEGHALNVFETTDKGLIYVDNTQADQIAYIEIGQLYMAIHLDALKSEYITCSGDPDEFWGSLTYTTHSNPFRYDYCVDYYRRVQFREESVVAYNEAVDAYNRGSSEWSYSRLTRWLENIEALGEDLGSIFYEPMGTVENVEVCWN